MDEKIKTVLVRLPTTFNKPQVKMRTICATCRRVYRWNRCPKCDNPNAKKVLTFIFIILAVVGCVSERDYLKVSGPEQIYRNDDHSQIQDIKLIPLYDEFGNVYAWRMQWGL